MNHVIKSLLVIFVLLNAVFAHCEEQELETSDYSYGEVVKVTDRDISVLEYDYESDEEKAVNYSVLPDTNLTNIGSIADLVKGDTVEVYFKGEGESRVARMIIKDDTSNPMDDQTPAP